MVEREGKKGQIERRRDKERGWGRIRRRFKGKEERIRKIRRSGTAKLVGLRGRMKG
jgi:hypothetical protein